MSSYTTELRTIIEQASQYETGLTLDQKIEKGRTKLFDFNYPIYDDDYKKIFETNFIKNFYMREIGFETEELFKFRLNNWLNINMGYFNKLFESELKTFDIFSNYKIDTTKNKTNDKTQTSTNKTDGTTNSVSDATNNQTTDTTKNVTNHEQQTGTQSVDGTNTTTNDDFNRNIDADTPDMRLNLTANDGEGILEYASKINESNSNRSQNQTTASDTDTSNTTDSTIGTTGNVTGESTTHDQTDLTSSVTNTGNGTINEIEDYIESKIGKVGDQSYSSMLNEYRSTLLRVERDIFTEMNKELFMLVY